MKYLDFLDLSKFASSLTGGLIGFYLVSDNSLSKTGDQISFVLFATFFSIFYFISNLGIDFLNKRKKD